MFHNGYQYHNNGHKNGTTYYKCAKSMDFFCAETAKVTQNGHIFELKPHSAAHIQNMDNEAVWKKMRSLNYLPTVNSNPHALKSLRMLMALPLLPGVEIEQGFLLIKAYAIHHNVPMPSLFEYYQSYWIRSVGVDILTVNGAPRRTNNNLESFHNELRHRFSVNHPNLWVFLGQICRLSSKYHTIITQISNGLQPTRNLKSRYLLNSKHIKNSTEQHDAGILSVWQFLMKCSHSSASYERRQRNWVLGITNDNNFIDVILEDNFNGDDIDENHLQDISPELNHHVPKLHHNVSHCMTCTIVMGGENVPQYIVLPCGHAWVCEGCISVLDSQYPKRCPLCRGDVNTFQRMFLT